MSSLSNISPERYRKSTILIELLYLYQFFHMHGLLLQMVLNGGTTYSRRLQKFNEKHTTYLAIPVFLKVFELSSEGILSYYCIWKLFSTQAFLLIFALPYHCLVFSSASTCLLFVNFKDLLRSDVEHFRNTFVPQY